MRNSTRLLLVAMAILLTYITLDWLVNEPDLYGNQNYLLAISWLPAFCENHSKNQSAKPNHLAALMHHHFLFMVFGRNQS